MTLIARKDQQPEQLFATPLLEEIVDTFKETAERKGIRCEETQDLLETTDRCLEDWLIPESRGIARLGDERIGGINQEMITYRYVLKNGEVNPEFIDALFNDINEIFEEKAFESEENEEDAFESEEGSAVLSDDDHEAIAEDLSRILLRWFTD